MTNLQRSEVRITVVFVINKIASVVEEIKTQLIKILSGFNFHEPFSGL